jgi:hypothetical protein
VVADELAGTGRLGVAAVRHRVLHVRNLYTGTVAAAVKNNSTILKKITRRNLLKLTVRKAEHTTTAIEGIQQLGREHKQQFTGCSSNAPWT